MGASMRIIALIPLAVSVLLGTIGCTGGQVAVPAVPYNLSDHGVSVGGPDGKDMPSMPTGLVDSN